MEDVAGGRDRVAAVKQRPACQARGRQKTERCRLVAGDTSIAAGGEICLWHPVMHREELGRFAEMVAGLQCIGVCRRYGGVLRELLVDPAQGRLERAFVQPEHQAEREEVLRAVDLLRVQAAVLQGPRIHAGDGHLDHPVAGERAVFERVGLVGCLAQVGVGELVCVHYDRSALGKIGEVCLQGRGVHRHKHVWGVPRGVDVVTGEAYLERTDARQRTGWSTNFGREVGDGADVVSDQRGGVRELKPGDL